MLTKLISKAIGLFVRIRFADVPPELRSFYKDTYLCQIRQWKYFFKDYVIRKPYKELSFDGEFAPELLFVLPFAYWHHMNGTLKSTVASKYTGQLYFFSPDHTEKFNTRSNEGNYNFETPRILYSHDYNMKKWLQVPLKDIYKNSIYQYDKPILVIANRYNMEWDGPPISYFDIPALEFMIGLLKSDYTIIYNRPRPENITMDNSDVYELRDYEWLQQNHPDVILLDDLYQENKANAANYNHLQMMVYANAENFISIHGGTATLASYFGGQNLILSKKGPEHYFRCFETLYPRLSGASVYHARNDEELRKLVTEHFVREQIRK